MHCSRSPKHCRAVASAACLVLTTLPSPMATTCSYHPPALGTQRSRRLPPTQPREPNACHRTGKTRNTLLARIKGEPPLRSLCREWGCFFLVNMHRRMSWPSLLSTSGGITLTAHYEQQVLQYIYSGVYVHMHSGAGDVPPGHLSCRDERNRAARLRHPQSK